MISVIIASRERPVECYAALHNLLLEAKNPIEIILRLDNDDPQLDTYIKTITSNILYNSTHIIIGFRYDGYRSLGMFMNQCAKLTTGDIIMMYSDDAGNISGNWDISLEDAAKRYKHGVAAFGATTDPIGWQWSMPAITRKWYEAIDNQFVLDDFLNVDRVIRDSALRLGIGYVCDFTYKHYHPEFKYDQKNQEINVLTLQNMVDDNAREGWISSYKYEYDNQEEWLKGLKAVTQKTIKLLRARIQDDSYSDSQR